MLRIAICDDEKAVVTEISQAIESAVREMEENVEIYRFTNGNEIFDMNIKFNLIFLDIEMPGSNGIEIAERIRSTDPHVQIVYVTNYRDYMKKAYRVHAFDYIQKPADRESIGRVIEDYIKTIETDSENTLEFTSISSEKVYIDPNRIIYVSCGYKKRTVIIITADAEYICKGRITDIYGKLDGLDFFMPHRSHIINLSMVRSFKKNEKIVMINGDEIPLSKGNSADFERQLARKMHLKVNRRGL